MKRLSAGQFADEWQHPAVLGLIAFGPPNRDLDAVVVAPLERLNKDREIKRRSKVVGIFSNRGALLRLVGR